MFTKKIISDACNGVSETHAKRTRMDQVFFYSTMVEEILRQRGGSGSKRTRTTVTYSDLRACWSGVGGSAPGDTTLRKWLDVCKYFTAPAMRSLKIMTEEALDASERCEHNHERITQNFLSTDTFKGLHDEPRVQALFLDIYARYPKSTGQKIDVEAVLKQARDAVAWMEGIELVVPEKEWTDNLKQMVHSYAFAKVGDYTNYLKPHLQRTRRELRDLEGRLPQHAATLAPREAKIVLAQPTGGLRNILQKDANLRPFLEAYDQELVATKSAINARNLQVELPSSQDDDPRQNAGENDKDDDVDRDDGEDREGDEDFDNNDRGAILCNELQAAGNVEVLLPGLQGAPPRQLPQRSVR